MFSHHLESAYVLTPHNWKILMKIILIAMQFAVWLTGYQELGTTQAEALQDRNLPIVIEQLTGEGAFAVPTW